MKEKKEFKQAEVEVIRFEKTDVIATSTVTITGGGQDAINGPTPGSGPAIPNFPNNP